METLKLLVIHSRNDWIEDISEQSSSKIHGVFLQTVEEAVSQKCEPSLHYIGSNITGAISVTIQIGSLDLGFEISLYKGMLSVLSQPQSS